MELYLCFGVYLIRNNNKKGTNMTLFNITDIDLIAYQVENNTLAIWNELITDEGFKDLLKTEIKTNENGVESIANNLTEYANNNLI